MILRKTQVTTYLVAYTVSEDLTLAAGYASSNNELDGQADVDASYINIAAMYRIAENADMGIDIKQDH